MKDRIVGVEFSERERILIATLEGEVDGSNASELRLAISDRLPSSAAGLVLDIAEVRYLDSSGIHLLFDLGRRLSARRQVLRLVIRADSPTRRVLDLCDIASVAPMDATLDSAVEAIESHEAFG